MSDCHSRGETRQRWTPRPDGLEESVWFTPGYNCPVTGGKGHGVHSMQITWLLRGPAGVVMLTFGTPWTPGELRPGHGLSPDGTRAYRTRGRWSTDPSGWGIGICTPGPQYEGHEAADGCLVLPGGRCYHQNFLSAADEFIGPFMAQGEQVIWDELERRYAELGEADRNALAMREGAEQ